MSSQCRTASYGSTVESAPLRPQPWRLSTSVQREEATSQNQSWGRGPSFGPAKSIEEAQAEETVNKIIAAMGPAATKVIPYQRPAVASAEQSAEPTAQALSINDVAQRSDTLALQRSGSGGGAQVEGGVVASAQLCYNLCTGEVTLVGWLWAGAGVKLWGGWYGAYYFWEGSRKVG